MHEVGRDLQEVAPLNKSRGQAFKDEILETMAPDDRAALELLDQVASTMDELAEMEADVRARGTTIPGARGQVVAHPNLTSVVRHRKLLSDLLGALFGDPGAETQTEKARRAARARWQR
jgi:hypothetical protein